jgi:hypothetical protein
VRRRGSSSAARNPACSRRHSPIERVRELHQRSGKNVHEEFENGSPNCSVYARLRATEVRRGRSWVSSEVLSGPRTWKASWATGEANRVTGAAWK